MPKCAPLSFAVLLMASTALSADDLPGWAVVWNDEFAGHALDLSKWEFEVNAHGGGNNELQYYVTLPLLNDFISF